MKLKLIAVWEVCVPQTWFELAATVRVTECGEWGIFVALWPQLGFFLITTELSFSTLVRKVTHCFWRGRN
jgi:hypothetical protein